MLVTSGLVRSSLLLVGLRVAPQGVLRYQGACHHCNVWICQPFPNECLSFQQQGEMDLGGLGAIESFFGAISFPVSSLYTFKAS